MKILLTSVIGPYAVDDRFGRESNRMELFHNQVTREQGLFSLRFHHYSFGLYFIAENIKAPTKVLDFPSEKEFLREIRRGYDMVGISFIMPNFEKARHMARLIREHAPGVKIVLGGHGTSVPDVEDKIDHDHICRGEGVRWFRELLGEDPDRPYKHPIIPAGFQKRAVGVPIANESAVLVPGVGCPNACRFCATSHFFNKEYTPYFDSGRELYDICVEAEEKGGYTEFFIMDENFLKRPDRAREFLDLLEANKKSYQFAIFSSAETIKEVGVEFLARLGVYFVWIGVESKRVEFDKNQGIDAKALIRNLREWGISTLASGILFLEHHDKETIWDDIKFMVGLESDFVQFMGLGPLPGTRLYADYAEKGKLNLDMPPEECHGQDRIWFHHPKFTGEESSLVLRDAFRYDYDQQGSWMLRRCETLLLGMEKLAGSEDPVLQRRQQRLRHDAAQLRLAFAVMKKYAHNEGVLAKTRDIIARYDKVFGPASLKQRAANVAALAFASKENRRVKAGTTASQPKMLRTKYRMSARDLVAGALKGKSLSDLLHVDIQWGEEPVLDLKGTLDKVNAKKLTKIIRTYLRTETSGIALVLDRLGSVDEKALRRLLKKVKGFQERIRIRFAEGAENVRKIVEGLPQDMVQRV